MKILMVCLGNICRSPLAEGILKQKSEGLSWVIESAGTGAYHVGEAPDPRSIAVGRKHGIDISGQRAQQFKARHFDEFDRIYVMDSSNYQNVMKLASGEDDRSKVEILMNESRPNRNEAVPDPYWGDDGFENVYQMIDEACNSILKKFS